MSKQNLKLNSTKLREKNAKTNNSSALLREGRFQLKTQEEAKNFAYIQMKIEDPNITLEYLSKKNT
jgi:hypothetical protein